MFFGFSKIIPIVDHLANVIHATYHLNMFGVIRVEKVFAHLILLLDCISNNIYVVIIVG